MKGVDAYRAAFKKTPLLMLIGGKECLAYAAHQGAGWRADCLGDMGGFGKHWNHMRKGYPVWIAEAGLQDVWKTSPVAWESCWDLRKWVDEHWSLRFIFNYALACHASYLNNKSAPLSKDENVRPEIERFLRRLGYRLVLAEWTHDASARAGAKMAMTMRWQNTGSAPCYRPYRVAYRLSHENGFSRAFVSEVAVNRWMPGSIEMFTEEFFKEPKDLPPGELNTVTDTITLPESLEPGTYRLSIWVVEPATGSPVVRLGIKGRAGDGWYPLSKVTISK